MGLRSLPVIVIGDKRLRGFNPKAIDEALRASSTRLMSGRVRGTPRPSPSPFPEGEMATTHLLPCPLPFHHVQEVPVHRRVAGQLRVKRGDQDVDPWRAMTGSSCQVAKRPDLPPDA